MPAFCFFLALGLGFSALLFWEANQQISIGTSWAVDVCSTAYVLPSSRISRLCRRRDAHPGDRIQTRQCDGMSRPTAV
jgi:hypothetical protein